jgi:hypothetical protein
VHPRTDNGSGTWDKPMGHDTVLRVITRSLHPIGNIS